jgi:hypothetical protein
MKSTPLHNNPEKTHLKVIKNTNKRKKKATNRIYINTLIPGFSYRNHLGETILPNNCSLL